jgi:hypothetical protein
VFKRTLLVALLLGALLPLAGCRLFHRDCDETDRRSNRDCDRR